MITASRTSSLGVMSRASEVVQRRDWKIAARRSQERTRNLVGALGFLAFLIVLLVTGHFSGLTSMLLQSPSVELPGNAADRSFHRTRTGQIVFVPRTGHLCGKILFNNATGQFRDTDPVQCQEVLPQSVPVVGDNGGFGASISAVRDGFNKR
jgi:hypothetical protein